MSTEILFNSPALHSLKRDQLVKLCKIHSVKANGKSTELIERLKQRALELPPGALLADSDDPMEGVEMQLPGGMPMDADADEDERGDSEDFDMQDAVLTSRFAIPRPSEQWEVVMDDIAEVDEVTMGTASSKDSLRTTTGGEFGSHSSKTTVSSSIKALANSLGIKRATSKSSHRTQDSEIDEETNPKMPSFSPGKIFSAKARDSLAAHATRYSDIPFPDALPETDHFKFSTPDASFMGFDEDPPADGGEEEDAKSLPKPVLRSGITMSAGVKSTIRLVSQSAAPRADYNSHAYMSPPRLPVVQTDFELTMGTPGTMRSLNRWPASSSNAGASTEEQLYPKLPGLNSSTNDGDKDSDDHMPGGMGMITSTPVKTFPNPSLVATSVTKSPPGPVDEPDMFSPSKPRSAASAAPATSGPSGPHTTIPRSTPFLFGSPLPRRDPGSAVKSIDRSKEDDAAVGVSNAAFDGVAKSVLEEMQRRVAQANGNKASTSDKPLPSQPIFGGLVFGLPAADGAGAETAQDRFAKAHEAQFNKMDSIANHYAALRPNKRKSDALGPSRSMAGQKRRSSAAGARVISTGRRKMAVPGGFGAEDDAEEDELEKDGKREEDAEEDVGARRSSKRMRITQGWDVHRGQRVSLAPPLPPADEEKKQKEREAVKRDLDAAKARRRSSRGRPSIGAPPAKGKASRFGFFASTAKSLVRNVWGMGGKAKPAAANAPSSSIPVPKASQAPAAAPAGAIAEKKAENTKVDAAQKQPPSLAGNTRKASGSQPRAPSVSSTSSKLLKPSSSATDAKTIGTIASTKSANSTSSNARLRSPIPSFNAPSGIAKPHGIAASRSSSIAGTARSRVSSVGSATGTTASRQSGRTSIVSSVGTRTSIASGGSAGISSIGTRRSLATTNTTASTSSKKDKPLVDGKDQPAFHKRTSSLLAPTASSLAKTAAAKPSLSGRSSGLPSVAEAQNPKRTSITQIPQSKASITSPNSLLSPRPTRIFSQPLTNFRNPASSPGATPMHQPSLTAAAASIMNNAADTASSPSKIPRPAVLPPKPKQLIARKPRISRSRVIAKLGAQRAAVAQGSSSLGSPGTRTRSSLGAARRSFGGVKSGGRASAGADVMRSAVKKRARQSEYARRKSHASENKGPIFHRMSSEA